jgi:hypothetical protein
MNQQNNSQTEAQQPTQQPIIINNVMSQPDDSGKKKAPGFLKVCVYSILTGGIYFFYWLVKSINGGYRKR